MPALVGLLAQRRCATAPFACSERRRAARRPGRIHDPRGEPICGGAPVMR
ncbi:hypothetical protein Rrhod_3793 [Rhodococcus rhodnii LMG 5362]|uniref:Uncharacterized protein n=1 Tax=Rhodococcus rhodnii LMG 5362 TaxID=1273125 RepID=R7WIB5_9NOCA|nr:hypothetical protein Rrhod_3793 [Rhodococcus rhodnii LMG 5362]